MRPTPEEEGRAAPVPPAEDDAEAGGDWSGRAPTGRADISSPATRLIDFITPASPRMAHMWLAVAGLCLIAAAAFWWRGQMDAAFTLATLGVVAWFLEERKQLRWGDRDNAPRPEEFRGEGDMERDRAEP